MNFENIADSLPLESADPGVEDNDIASCKAIVKHKLIFWRNVEAKTREELRNNFRTKELERNEGNKTIFSRKDFKRISQSSDDVRLCNEYNLEYCANSKNIQHIESKSACNLSKSKNKLYQRDIGSRNVTVQDKDRQNTHMGIFVKTKAILFESSNVSFSPGIQRCDISDEKSTSNLQTAYCPSEFNSNTNETARKGEETDSSNSYWVHSSSSVISNGCSHIASYDDSSLTHKCLKNGISVVPNCQDGPVLNSEGLKYSSYPRLSAKEEQRGSKIDKKNGEQFELVCKPDTFGFNDYLDHENKDDTVESLERGESLCTEGHFKAENMGQRRHCPMLGNYAEMDNHDRYDCIGAIFSEDIPYIDDDDNHDDEAEDKDDEEDGDDNVKRADTIMDTKLVNYTTKVRPLRNESFMNAILEKDFETSIERGSNSVSEKDNQCSEASEVSDIEEEAVNQELLGQVTDAAIFAYSQLAEEKKSGQSGSGNTIAKLPTPLMTGFPADRLLTSGCNGRVLNASVQTLTQIDNFKPKIFVVKENEDAGLNPKPLLHTKEVTKNDLHKAALLVETVACRDAIEEAKNGRNVIIKGDKCSGVTCSINSIMANLQTSQEVNVIKITSSEDFRVCVNTPKHYIIFIDDFMGKSPSDKTMWKEWTKCLTDMNTYSTTKRGSVIVGMKNDVYVKHKDELDKSEFFTDGYIIDLSNETYIVSREEILSILEKKEEILRDESITSSLSREDLSKIAHSLPPQFALEYINKFYQDGRNRRQGISFFNKPVNTLLDCIRSLNKSPESRIRHFILSALVLGLELDPVDMYKNDTERQHGEFKHRKTLKQLLDKERLNFEKKTQKQYEYEENRDALEKLGFILKDKHGIHVITSETVRISVWLSLLDQYPREKILACDFQVIKDCIRNKVTNEFEHEMMYSENKSLAKRFAREILRGNVDDVATHPLFDNIHFAECFKSYVCNKTWKKQWQLWSVRDSTSNNTFIINVVKHTTGVAEVILQHPKWNRCSQDNKRSNPLRKALKGMIKFASKTSEKENNIHIDVRKENQNAISNAVLYDNINAFKRLHNLDTPIHGKDLVQAAQSGSCKILEYILSETDLVFTSGVDAFLAASDVYCAKFVCESGKSIYEALCILLKQIPKMDSVNAMSTTLMHLSVDKKYKDSLRLLLQFNHFIDPRDEKGETPLHWAIRQNFEDIVFFLVEMGASVKNRNDSGETALHMSVGRNYKILQFLVERTHNVDIRDSNGMTPLHKACRVGDKVCADILLAAKADTITLDSEGRQSIHHAAENGNHEIIEVLIRHGANVNTQDKNGATPMHFAVEKGHVLASQVLIKTKADVISEDSKGRLPLYLAMKHDRKDIIETIIVNCHDNAECLFQVARHGSTSNMESFLRNTTVRNFKDNFGKPLIEEAIESGNTGTTICLLQKGLTANFFSQYGFPLTFIAVGRGDCVMLKLLLDYGADIQMCDLNQNIAIHICCARGNVPILEMILNMDPTLVHKSNRRGWTPLHFAAYYGKPDIVDILLRYNAVCIAKTHRGDLPTDLAIEGSFSCGKFRQLVGTIMTQFGSHRHYQQIRLMLEGTPV